MWTLLWQILAYVPLARVYVHMRSDKQPAWAPPSKRQQQRQLSEISTYLPLLCLAFLPLSHHLTPGSRLLLHLCFRTFSLTPLPLSAQLACQGQSPPKRNDVFTFIFISHFCRVLFFETPAQRNPYHVFFFFFSVHQPAKTQFPWTPTTPTITTAQSIRQQASLTDSCLISHKLVLPLTHFLFCFLLLLIPFSTCPLPPSTSPWSSHFIFLPTNATQQSLKKCHFCLLLLFCNFFMSLLFSGEFIYRWLFFCPQLSDLSVSVLLSMSVSLSLSLTLCCSISFLLSLSFSFLHTIEKCHINADGKCCIFDALLY